ncbi:MAG: hypothetical protein ACOC5A_06830, partial [Halanaerobiales bacterium]
MKRMLTIISSIILFLAITTISVDAAPAYRTLEGKIFLRGSEPLVKRVLVTEEGDFSLKGDYKEDFGNLSRVQVRVTGKVSKSGSPMTDGSIDVEKYTIIADNFKEDTDWVVGSVREADGELLLLGEGHIVYRIEGLSSGARNKLQDSRALVTGEVHSIEDYYSLIKAE